jgi:hypothetical protein
LIAFLKRIESLTLVFSQNECFWDLRLKFNSLKKGSFVGDNPGFLCNFKYG